MLAPKRPVYMYIWKGLCGWAGLNCEHNILLADPGGPTASDSPHQRQETPAGTPGVQVMKKSEIIPQALEGSHTDPLIGDCWPQTVKELISVALITLFRLW